MAAQTSASFSCSAGERTAAGGGAWREGRLLELELSERGGEAEREGEAMGAAASRGVVVWCWMVSPPPTAPQQQTRRGPSDDVEMSASCGAGERAGEGAGRGLTCLCLSVDKNMAYMVSCDA